MARTLRTSSTDSPAPEPRGAPGRSVAASADRRLQVLLEVTRAIGTIQDPDALVHQIMHHVTRAFAADRSTLFLRDAVRKQLWSKVAQGLDGESRELREIRVPDDRGLCGHVAQTLRPLLVRDALCDPRFARDVADQTGYVPRAMMVVPVAHRPGRCDGVLQVMDRRVGVFKVADLGLLQAISVQVGVSLDNARLYAAQRRQFDSFVRALSAALDARDPTTQVHSVNVANYATGIAHYLGLPPSDLSWLRYAGLLHDVGKIGTPEAILTKPGRLEPHEFEEMKKHAAHSRRILSQIEFMDELAGLDFIAAAHHEKLDGSGYPDGLRGEQLPLKARILAVADIFDALTSDRQYRKGMPTAEALAIIDGMTPHQLDAGCVGALKEFMGCGGGLAGLGKGAG